MTYSSSLKMEVICSSEMSVDLQWTTQHYIPEDRTLHKTVQIAREYNDYNIGKLIMEMYGLPGFVAHHSFQMIFLQKLILTHFIKCKNVIHFLKENKSKNNLYYSRKYIIILGTFIWTKY
jgi:hypothetical protein